MRPRDRSRRRRRPWRVVLVGHDRRRPRAAGGACTPRRTSDHDGTSTRPFFRRTVGSISGGSVARGGRRCSGGFVRAVRFGARFTAGAAGADARFTVRFAVAFAGARVLRFAAAFDDFEAAGDRFATARFAGARRVVEEVAERDVAVVRFAAVRFVAERLAAERFRVARLAAARRRGVRFAAAGRGVRLRRPPPAGASAPSRVARALSELSSRSAGCHSHEALRAPPRAE
jgi:hypothetical protein